MSHRAIFFHNREKIGTVLKALNVDFTTRSIKLRELEFSELQRIQHCNIKILKKCRLLQIIFDITSLNLLISNLAKQNQQDFRTMQNQLVIQLTVIHSGRKSIITQLKTNLAGAYNVFLQIKQC